MTNLIDDMVVWPRESVVKTVGEEVGEGGEREREGRKKRKKT